MNSKWIINKIAAVVTSIAVILAFIKYFRIYDFNISTSNRFVFWVPVALIGVVGVIIYVITFKVKKDEK